MSVGRICSRTVFLADAGETAAAAAKRMLDEKVGLLVILNERRQPAGVVTDRDLTTRVMGVARDPEKTLVSAVMTPNPLTVSEDSPIEAALGTMRAGGFRRLPVVGDREELVGILSLDDILSLLAEEFAKIGGLLSAVREAGR